MNPAEAAAAAAAADVEAAAHALLLASALVDLEAAADTLRDTLARSVRTLGYRRTAEVTGLTLGTVQRWHLEVPVCPTLRQARIRRCTFAPASDPLTD